VTHAASSWELTRTSGRSRSVVDAVGGHGHRVIHKESYQDALKELTAMTVDPTVLTWSLPRAERRFRLAQWTGTATSASTSAAATTIGFGRR
jgi:hypothetical protein